MDESSSLGIGWLVTRGRILEALNNRLKIASKIINYCKMLLLHRGSPMVVVPDKCASTIDKKQT